MLLFIVMNTLNYTRQVSRYDTETDRNKYNKDNARSLTNSWTDKEGPCLYCKRKKLS